MFCCEGVAYFPFLVVCGEVPKANGPNHFWVFPVANCPINAFSSMSLSINRIENLAGFFQIYKKVSLNKTVDGGVRTEVKDLF